MTAPNVGDVVAWEKVPDGALVLHMCHLYERHGRWGCTRAYWNGEWFSSYAEGWIAGYQWSDLFDDDEPRIVALGLTGQETAADLQRLAEVFEVREAFLALPGVDGLRQAVGALFDEVFAPERLHALGWRKGQTAEDAARLLAEAGK